MKTSILVATALCLGAALTASATSAQTTADTSPSAFVPEHAGQFVLTARVTTVAPSENGDIVTSAGASTGLRVGVTNDTVPTLGFMYFFTDNVAGEAILGTSQHTISADGTANTPVHKTWVLPPVIAMQYHFNPAGQVSPYVGAGVSYMDWYNGKNLNGFSVKLKSGAGTAVQAGVDIALSGPWALNLDYKKVFYKTNASINGGALKSKVTLDPAVVSIGMAYRY